jgi:hypothetical protein
MQAAAATAATRLASTMMEWQPSVLHYHLMRDRGLSLVRHLTFVQCTRAPMPAAAGAAAAT